MQVSSDLKLPYYVKQYDDKYYCFLRGELDKSGYPEQCSKCPLRDICSTKKETLKDVPSDWHSINAEGFFGAEFTECKDPVKKKKFRNKSKIGGLALIYGGSAHTIGLNFGVTKEEAEININNFFRKLIKLKKYMDGAKERAIAGGMVYNLFGRQRDIRSDSHPPERMPFKEKNKRKGYAERTALNYPIQSTAGEFLKLGSIRVDQIIRRNQWNPYCGDTLTQEYPEGELPDYTDFKVNLASSVHDELMYTLHENAFEEVIPQLYVSMQLDDILKYFEVKFTLELDCEYDGTRSWTSTKKFDTAQIYLLRDLQGITSQGGYPVLNKKTKEEREQAKPNLAMTPFEAVTPEIVRRLIDYVPSETSEPLITLGVVADDDTFYPWEEPLPQSFIESLGIPFNLVFYPGATK